MLYPEIGKLYTAFDKESAHPSAMYSIRVVSITNIDKIDEDFKKLLLKQKRRRS